MLLSFLFNTNIAFWATITLPEIFSIKNNSKVPFFHETGAEAIRPANEENELLQQELDIRNFRGRPVLYW